MFARIFRTDAAIIGSAWHGLRSIFSPPSASGLTYVNESFWPMLVLLLMLGLPPDMFVRHLLVPQPYAAWNVAIDAVAIASTLWLAGLFGSMAARPHAIGGGAISLNLGLFASVGCEAKNLRSAEVLPDFKRRGAGVPARSAAFLTVPGCNVVRVEFSEPVALRKYPYLRERLVIRAYVASDRPGELVAALDRARAEGLGQLTDNGAG